MTTPKAELLTKREILTLGTLCFVNVVNYMDRYTIAGVLIYIQADFGITDDLAGLLQTGFIFSYMVFSPLLGYLGDRYSRRLLLIICILFWMLMTITGSCAPNYPIFFVTRALVGVGEAGFTTIAPAVISDIVTNDARSTTLAYFYTAIPLGVGLGYLAGAKIAQWTGEWRWGLRATPVLGAIGCVCLCFGVEPIQGGKEAAAVGGQPAAVTSYKDDLLYLLRNRSFALSTAASTCVCFVTGTLGWWAPKCLYYGFKILASGSYIDPGTVYLQFGVITSTTGIVGVSLGSLLSRYLRRSYPSVDPVICGVGLLLSMPFIIGAIAWCVVDKLLTFVCLTIGQFALNLNWAVVMDILLYITTPQRRASASAIQMLVSHALGDCFSPYIVGVMSEYYKKHLKYSNELWLIKARNSTIVPTADTDYQIVYALQRSLFTIMVLQFIGAVLFLYNTRFIDWDRSQAVKLLVEK